MKSLRTFLGLGLALTVVGSAAAQAPSYVKDVRPFLDKYCVDCHDGPKGKAGVQLESYEGLVKGKKKVVVAGDPGKSPIVLCTEGAGGSKKMPPKKAKNQPTAKEIAVLREWVKAGAKDDSAKKSQLDEPQENEVTPVVFQETPKLKDGDRIVFLGDSITQQGNGNPKGYLNVIREHLAKNYPIKSDKEDAKKKPASTIEVIGAGISGNKVPNLQQRVDRDVVARKPTIVFIYIGINDVWHGETNPANGTSPERFESGLKEVIGKIEKGGARVILCTPTVIGELKDGANKNDKKLDQYADISRKIAKDGNLPLCDLRKAFVDYLAKNNEKNSPQSILTTDRVHLGPRGDRLVAETMLKTLGEKLGE